MTFDFRFWRLLETAGRVGHIRIRVPAGRPPAGHIDFAFWRETDSPKPFADVCL